MKKFFFLLLLSTIGISVFPQVGISTESPTRMLDVEGDARVREQSDLLFPNASYLLVADDSGVLKKATSYDVMFSSGLYVGSDPNDNWSNIYVGTRASLLEFTGRIADSALDFNFKLFYKRGEGFKVISQTNVTVSSINATSFRVNYGTISYTFQLTLTGNFANIKATKTTGGGYWSQGAFKILPILD